MTRYYCPFCPSRFQFHKNRRYGVIICGQCVDELTKVYLISFSQVIGVLGVSAFILPLFMMIVLSVKDIDNQIRDDSTEQLAFFSLNLDYEKY